MPQYGGVSLRPADGWPLRADAGGLGLGTVRKRRDLMRGVPRFRFARNELPLAFR